MKRYYLQITNIGLTRGGYNEDKIKRIEDSSCRVLEKAGFIYEGTLKSNAVKNGAVIDMNMYGLIKDVGI